MTFFKKHLLLLVIIFAFILRFDKLATVPPALTWDEVAWGYNAYSLGIDFRDEFGKFLPTTYLESFGDFKPPLYAYLSVIPVKLFGLNEFSIRFVSAFFGSLTVFLTYLLVSKIFNNKSVALLSSLLLAISPWHIMLSRAAFEANLASFFIILGVYLFFVSLEKKSLLVFSLISFILSMYTFNTARIVSPLLVIGLFFVHRKSLFNFKKETILAITISIFIFLPLAIFMKTPQAQLRFKEVNIFSDPQVVERSNQESKNDSNAIWSKVIHNRRFAYGVEFLHHYFDNLNPSFLFVKGDGNPKFSIQDVGQMYVWEFPFFIAGILFLFKKREGKWWIIPYWLVVALIPAGTARETPHALRIEAAIPTFQVLSAYGVYYVIRSVNSKFLNYNLKIIFVYGLIIIAALNFLYFYHNLMSHYPKEFAGEWQYGYKDAISYIKEVEGSYEKIFITSDLGRPYAYTLFYTKYDPQKFRSLANIEREPSGFVHVKSFGKYNFLEKDSPPDGAGKFLVIDSPVKIPSGVERLKTFYLPNGEEILVAYRK